MCFGTFLQRKILQQWLLAYPSLPVTRVFQDYPATLDTVSRSWDQLRSSAAKYNNLIGEEGQYWGALAKNCWGEHAVVSEASLQRMLRSSMEMGAKGGSGRNLMSSWKCGKNNASIF